MKATVLQEKPFEEFADEIRPEALAYARKLTNNAEDAADLVQDALLRAFRSVMEKKAVPGKAWIKTIMLRRLIDLKRARKSRIQAYSLDTLCSTGDAFDVPYTDDGFEESLNRLHVERAIELAIGKLDRRQQEIIHAAMVTDLDMGAMAAQFQTSRSAMKGRLDRAFTAVRAVLAEGKPRMVSA